jgi:microcompartment protein CcmK/EutM
MQAGEGDTVLVLREGTGIRQLFGLPATAKWPIRSCIVGIVDAAG